MSFEIFDEIFDHRDNDDQKQRNEDGWFSFGESDGWDDLHDSHDQEVY